jgi:hypothetical protein
MEKTKMMIIVYMILISMISFSNLYTDAYDYTYKVAKYYGVADERAKLIAKAVAEEYEKFPQVPYQIFVAVIVSESGFKNLYGDNGYAVGYCQLHQTSIWYVNNFFPEIRNITKRISHKDLIKFPELQIKIGYRYLYLIMKNITNYNIIEALNFWNNSPTYYQRVFKNLEWIETHIF